MIFGVPVKRAAGYLILLVTVSFFNAFVWIPLVPKPLQYIAAGVTGLFVGFATMADDSRRKKRKERVLRRFGVEDDGWEITATVNTAGRVYLKGNPYRKP